MSEGSNVVDIDPAALALEAGQASTPADALTTVTPGEAAAIEGPQPAGAERTIEQIQAAAGQWVGGCQLVVNGLADGIAPNWGIPPEDRERIANSLALALEAWFPDMAIPPKYAVLLVLGSSAWGAVTAVKARNGGVLPPLRLGAPSQHTSGAPSAPESTAGAGEGAFTTSA